MSSKKSQLRKEISKRIKSLTSVEIESFNKKAFQQIGSFFECRDFQKIILFASLPDEVDSFAILEKLLADGKNIYLPKTNPEDFTISIHPVSDLKQDLVSGEFGVMEPVTSAVDLAEEVFDSIIVPARGVDYEGGRLGRGKGCYDRLLPQLKMKNPKITIAGFVFHLQFEELIPMEENDFSLPYIISDRGIFQIR